MNGTSNPLCNSSCAILLSLPENAVPPSVSSSYVILITLPTTGSVVVSTLRTQPFAVPLVIILFWKEVVNGPSVIVAPSRNNILSPV